MTETLAKAKSDMRESIRARLKTMPPQTRLAASLLMCALLYETERWRTAKAILFFAPQSDEPNLWQLLEIALATGKLAALPGFDSATQSYCPRFIRDPKTDLVAGRFGILEPGPACELAPLNRLDFALVPGVAFDAQGRRLGRGKGFYDRLLTQVRGITCGVAFDEQIVATVPVEPHDIRLNCILTPTRLIETEGRAVFE